MDDPGGSLLLQILLVNVFLALDNSLLIIASTSHLKRWKAVVIPGTGIIIAVAMRWLLAEKVISKFIEVLPFGALGGIMLAFMTYGFIKGSMHNKQSERSWVLVLLSITFGDLVMSLDNTIYNVSQTVGETGLLRLSIWSNLPLMILFALGGRWLLKRFPFCVHIAGAVLGFAAIKLIIEDKWLYNYLYQQDINIHNLANLPYLTALFVFAFGVYENRDKVILLLKATGNRFISVVGVVKNLAYRVIYRVRLVER